MNKYYFEKGLKSCYYIEATVKHNNNDSIVSFSSYFITYITVHSALVCSKTIKALLKNESSSQTCTHSTLMNDPSLHRMATHSTLSTLFTSWKIVIIKICVLFKNALSYIWNSKQNPKFQKNWDYFRKNTLKSLSKIVYLAHFGNYYIRYHIKCIKWCIQQLGSHLIFQEALKTKRVDCASLQSLLSHFLLDRLLCKWVWALDQ